ncbi:hypothetical protein ZTR_10711 [Talaromyces verruculosus]|nr:hypothetical protein ZTR_10711 [Talaromyces verruculosus]
MQYKSPFALCSFIFLGLSAPVYSDSSTYYWKHFSTSGTISPWYENDNSWGVTAPEGTGFAVMVTGEDWGTWSPVHTLPKQLKDVSQTHNTWISQIAQPEPGYGYDACYDIFIDPVYAPTDRNSINEVMIWFGYQAPNAPLSDTYDASGHPVPVQTNVALGGRSWDVYLYT